MSKLKRLATKEDNIVVIESPITSTELSEREKDYPLLFPSDFAKKYRDLLFQPVKFHFKGQPFLIQFNRCTNPFCKWFGETQKRFEDLKYKPSRRESTTYHQKRNDILPDLAAQLLNRTPVKRSCEMLGIGSKTYYSKLEWLYRRCLKFLERHEAKAFAAMNFDKMWVNTDKMIYNLNNVRKRGQGGQS